MKTLAIAMLLFLGMYCHAQQKNEFEEMLQLANMSFDPLENFEEVPILPNDVMEYEYAAKNHVNDIEVRYAFRPIGVPNEFANEQERLDYLHQVEMENTYYKMYMMTAILNLSGGAEKSIVDLSEPEQKNIGADWAGSAFTVLKSDFAQGYKFCQLFVIHKKDRAICYCYFLSNDPVTLILESSKLVYNLKFN